MAERKAAASRAPQRPELDALIVAAKEVVLTEDDLQAQRASFVYGNAPENSQITKASAIEATKRVRLLDPT